MTSSLALCERVKVYVKKNEAVLRETFEVAALYFDIILPR